MFNMVVRMIIYVKLILIPSQTPKKTYFGYILVTTVGCALMMISKVIPDAAKVLIFIGALGFAPIRAGSALPYLLAYQYLSGPEFVTSLNMWTGLNKVGNIWAYFLKYLLVNVFGYSYIVFLGIYLALFFVAGLATYLFVKEIDMPETSELSCCEEAQ